MFKPSSLSVAIPTYNNARELAQTLKSIQELDYPPEKIYFSFLDFGSTDGTLELLLDLPRLNTGIFTCPGKPTGRTMYARAVRTFSLQGTPGRKLVLWPGDVLYADALMTMERRLYDAWRNRENCSFLIAEVDLRDEQGKVHSQTRLFNTAALFRSFSIDPLAYVDRGFRHQIMIYGAVSDRTDKTGAYFTYIRHWNQLGCLGQFATGLYIPDVVGSCPEFKPFDELDDLLFRFETIISTRMSAGALNNVILHDAFESSFRANLAHYALWRSWKLLKSDRKVAEDCQILAAIIFPELRQYEVWKRLTAFAHGASDNGEWLEVFFAKESPPANAPHPLRDSLSSRRKRNAVHSKFRPGCINRSEVP